MSRGRVVTPAVSPLVAGRTMVGIAIVGVLASLVGSVIAIQVIHDLDDGVSQSLEVTGTVLATVDDSFVVADDALAILSDGVAEAEAAIRALGASMEEGQGALDAVTELTGGDIADALESVREALPAVQSAASTIDTTLALLSSLPFGPSYDPDRPLGQSIGDLRGSLDGIPEQLRQQAVQVARTTSELEVATAGTLATADALAQIDQRLVEATGLLDDYASSTAEARVLVAEQQAELATGATRSTWLVIAFALVFAVGQFVPAYLGMALLQGVPDPASGA